MAGRKNKHAYLDDFEKDLNGNYQYRGAHYRYAGTPSRGRALAVLWLCCGGGDPMRAYIHEQTAQKLPTLTRACALFAVLAATGQGSAVFANGAQMLLGVQGIFILLEIFSAAAFAAAAAFSRRMRWEKE